MDRYLVIGMTFFGEHTLRRRG